MGGGNNVNKISFILSFTYEDLNKGVIPAGWERHWKDFVIAEKPFALYYNIFTDYCVDKDEFPAYCRNCESTFLIDTTIMNLLIKSGELLDYHSINYHIKIINAL